MFKKSLLDNVPTEPQMVGRTVFNGYADVRTSPKGAPRFLKQQLRVGKDPIALWFQHIYGDRFREWDQWSEIKLVADGRKLSAGLPKIQDMTPEEIMSFCKSIDVHPAHLVPFSDDQSLSLPQPLLELLIQIAYADISGEQHDLNDIYLAKAAIAYECKRIRNFHTAERQKEARLGSEPSFLSVIFKGVLDNPVMLNGIRKAAYAVTKKEAAHKLSQKFDSASAQTYPYLERVAEAALLKGEYMLEGSWDHQKIKREILTGRIKAFVRTYDKFLEPQDRADTAAMLFYEAVLEEAEERKIDIRMARHEQIVEIVRDALRQHKPYIQKFSKAHREFMEEHGVYQGLADDVFRVAMGELNMVTLENQHTELEGAYIMYAAKIQKAFDTIPVGSHQRNLMNNHVLLRLNNIGIEEYVPPQTSPR